MSSVSLQAIPMLFAFERLPRNPRILCVGNALKGSLSVKLTRTAMEMGVSLGGGTVAGGCCISDGGDGFLEAFTELQPVPMQRVVCQGLMGRLSVCDMLLDVEREVAIIETALCCGESQLMGAKRDIMNAGTGAVGDLILRALSMGAKKLYIGLGGTLTCDAGLGMLVRLQEGLLSSTRMIPHIAARHLSQSLPLDLTGMRRKLSKIEINVFCDVDNTLCGPKGASAVFAPQKGASPEQVLDLSRMLEKFADRCEEELRLEFRDAQGAGAAGGLGFAFAMLGAKLVPGAASFCDLLRLSDRIDACDALITCEGRFDRTSFHGKAPWTVAEMATGLGKKAVVACGTADNDAVARAAESNVRILEFARDATREDMSAQAFTRLQQFVRSYIKSSTPV